MSIFKRLDHVSIGVVDIQRALRLFVDVMGGGPLADRGETPAEGFRWASFMLGGKKVELVSPFQVGEGGVGRYIASKGEGFHHISISVENLAEAIKYFESHGIRILAANYDNPQWKHCYLNPKDTFGALFQVFEENDKTIADAS